MAEQQTEQVGIIRRGPTLRSGTGAVLLTFDAAVSQTHGLQAEVTDHPVEDGVDVTDHVRLRPVATSIQGIITATPFDEDGSDGRDIEGWDTLLRLIEAREPVTLVTTLRSYPDMIIVGATTTREGRKAVFPVVEFRQIRRVSQQVVTLPPEIIKKAAQKPKAPGTQDVGLPGSPEVEQALLGNVYEEVSPLIQYEGGNTFSLVEGVL